ncbi:MAG: anthrone oxygenase family protein [Pseudomonadota bacterium]
MQTHISAASTVSPHAQPSAARVPWFSLSLSVVALVAVAAVAGFFYAYSSSVMVGLNASTPEVALKAMQGINAEVRNPIFALSFFGSAILLPAATALLVVQGSRKAALPLGAASAVYILGGFMLTMVINVPMNEALAVVDVDALPDPAAAWADYAEPWTFWNHVRTVLSLSAVALAGLGIWRLR